MLDFVFIDYFGQQVVRTFTSQDVNSFIRIRNKTSSILLIYFQLFQRIG